MEREDILKIAEGIRHIEMGVSLIQRVMRTKKIKSLSDVAADLIPLFEDDDNILKQEIVKRLKV